MRGPVLIAETPGGDDYGPRALVPPGRGVDPLTADHYLALTRDGEETVGDDFLSVRADDGTTLLLAGVHVDGMTEDQQEAAFRHLHECLGVVPDAVAAVPPGVLQVASIVDLPELGEWYEPTWDDLPRGGYWATLPEGESESEPEADTPVSTWSPESVLPPLTPAAADLIGAGVPADTFGGVDETPADEPTAEVSEPEPGPEPEPPADESWSVPAWRQEEAPATEEPAPAPEPEPEPAAETPAPEPEPGPTPEYEPAVGVAERSSPFTPVPLSVAAEPVVEATPLPPAPVFVQTPEPEPEPEPAPPPAPTPEVFTPAPLAPPPEPVTPAALAPVPVAPVVEAPRPAPTGRVEPAYVSASADRSSALAPPVVTPTISPAPEPAPARTLGRKLRRWARVCVAVAILAAVGYEAFIDTTWDRKVRESTVASGPPTIIEREVPVEKIVERQVEVPKIVEVERRVEVPVEKIVEKRVEVPVIVEKRVEVPVEKIVEKIVEKPVVVEKIVEKPVPVAGPDTRKDDQWARFKADYEARIARDPVAAADLLADPKAHLPAWGDDLPADLKTLRDAYRDAAGQRLLQATQAACKDGRFGEADALASAFAASKAVAAILTEETREGAVRQLRSFVRNRKDEHHYTRIRELAEANPPKDEELGRHIEAYLGLPEPGVRAKEVLQLAEYRRWVKAGSPARLVVKAAPAGAGRPPEVREVSFGRKGEKAKSFPVAAKGPSWEDSLPVQGLPLGPGDEIEVSMGVKVTRSAVAELAEGPAESPRLSTVIRAAGEGTLEGAGLKATVRLEGFHTMPTLPPWKETAAPVLPVGLPK